MPGDDKDPKPLPKSILLPTGRVQPNQSKKTVHFPSDAEIKQVYHFRDDVEIEQGDISDLLEIERLNLEMENKFKESFGPLSFDNIPSASELDALKTVVNESLSAFFLILNTGNSSKLVVNNKQAEFHSASISYHNKLVELIDQQLQSCDPGDVLLLLGKKLLVLEHVLKNYDAFNKLAGTSESHRARSGIVNQMVDCRLAIQDAEFAAKDIAALSLYEKAEAALQFCEQKTNCLRLWGLAADQRYQAADAALENAKKEYYDAKIKMLREKSESLMADPDVTEKAKLEAECSYCKEMVELPRSYFTKDNTYDNAAFNYYCAAFNLHKLNYVESKSPEIKVELFKAITQTLGNILRYVTPNEAKHFMFQKVMFEYDYNQIQLQRKSINLNKKKGDILTERVLYCEGQVKLLLSVEKICPAEERTAYDFALLKAQLSYQKALYEKEEEGVLFFKGDVRPRIAYIDLLLRALSELKQQYKACEKEGTPVTVMIPTSPLSLKHKEIQTIVERIEALRARITAPPAASAKPTQ